MSKRMRMIKLICTRADCGIWFAGLRGDACPKCGGASMTERQRIATAQRMPEGDWLDAAGTRLAPRAALEAERAALYAIAEPTQEQWRRLHELDLALGY